LLTISEFSAYIGSTGPLLPDGNYISYIYYRLTFKLINSYIIKKKGILNGLMTSILGLLASIVHTLLAFLIALYYILAVLFKIITLGLPHIFKLIFIIIEFHRTQLGKYYIKYYLFDDYC